MSYIKIQKIKKENIDTPEKGYIYFGYDDDSVDGISSGFWLKDDDGSLSYILGQNLSKPIITNIYPLTAYNGDTISIYGSNFVPGDTTVTFNGIETTGLSVLSNNQLTVIVPYLNDEEVISDVVVSTTNGVSVSYQYTVIYRTNNPIITSVSSISGDINDTISIEGTNFILNDTIAWFNGHSGETIVYDTSTLTAIVPNMPIGTIPLFLENVSTSLQSNSIDFTVSANNVTFSHFYPTTTEVGDYINIIGTNFTDKTIVSIGHIQSYEINLIDSTHLNVIVPDIGLGNTTIRVDELIKYELKIIGSEYIPTINSITPPNISDGELIITGTNLDGDISVIFGGNDINVVSNTNNTCTVELISGISGTNSVFIINKYGKSNQYIYIIPTVIGGPTITSYYPTENYRDNSIHVYGTNFKVGSTANTIFFGGIQANASHFKSSSDILSSISTSSPTGPVDVKIINSNGSFITTGFTINPEVNPPTITEITNQFGKVGDLINIYGTNLNDCVISFGVNYPGTIATAQIISDTHIFVTIPDIVDVGTNKIVNIFANSVYGTFVYNPFDVYKLPSNPPKITSFTPIEGTQGTMITIYGNNFCKYWTDVYIYIDGEYYSLSYISNNIQFVSEHEIVGYIPTTSYFGLTSIKVVTPIGTDQKASFNII